MLGLGAAQPPPPDASCGACRESGERYLASLQGTAGAGRPPRARAAAARDRACRTRCCGSPSSATDARRPRRRRGARRLLARAAAAAGQGRARAGGTSAGRPPAAPAPRHARRRRRRPWCAAGSGVATARRAAGPPRPSAAEPLEAPPAEPSDALTPDEILRLVVLGRTREDAINLDPVEARRELAAVAAAPPPEPRLDVADATDEELWRLARAEVAIERPPRDDDDDAVSKQLERSWPDLDRFTDLLTKESLKRLEVLGPQFAEPLKTEARWRRKAYESWLRLVDGKGILPGPAGDLAYGEALFDPNGGLPAEASDEAKAAFVRLREERAELRAARNELRDWEKRALPDK